MCYYMFVLFIHVYRSGNDLYLIAFLFLDDIGIVIGVICTSSGCIMCY